MQVSVRVEVGASRVRVRVIVRVIVRVRVRVQKMNQEVPRFGSLGLRSLGGAQMPLKIDPHAS